MKSFNARHVSGKSVLVRAGKNKKGGGHTHAMRCGRDSGAAAAATSISNLSNLLLPAARCVLHDSLGRCVFLSHHSLPTLVPSTSHKCSIHFNHLLSSFHPRSGLSSRYICLHSISPRSDSSIFSLFAGRNNWWHIFGGILDPYVQRLASSILFLRISHDRMVLSVRKCILYVVRSSPYRGAHIRSILRQQLGHCIKLKTNSVVTISMATTPNQQQLKIYLYIFRFYEPIWQGVKQY